MSLPLSLSLSLSLSLIFKKKKNKSKQHNLLFFFFFFWSRQFAWLNFDYLSLISLMGSQKPQLGTWHYLRAVESNAFENRTGPTGLTTITAQYVLGLPSLQKQLSWPAKYSKHVFQDICMAYSKGFQTWPNSMAILLYSRAAIITIFHHYVTLRIQAHVKHIGPAMVDAYFKG